MTKHETTILKGVAILFMLYLHLFNQTANVDLCTTYLSIRGDSLVYLFSRCTNPVSFYLILSGYGLYISYKKTKKQFTKKRILRLYIHYWISLLIFVPLGMFVVGKQVYPGTFCKFIDNFTGWKTSYNGEIWFLFPYILLSLTGPYVFRILDKMSFITAFLTGGSIYFVSYCLIHFFGPTYLYSHQFAYMPILYLSLLFPFILGAMLIKYDVISKIQIGGGKALILLLFLMVTRMCIDTGVFHVLYAVSFIVLFLKLKRPPWLDNFLAEMGKRSTSMWFVHSYFCYYLFKDFIYGFKYPLLIFIILLLMSYLSAVVIDFVNKYAQKMIK